VTEDLTGAIVEGRTWPDMRGAKICVSEDFARDDGWAKTGLRPLLISVPGDITAIHHKCHSHREMNIRPDDAVQFAHNGFLLGPQVRSFEVPNAHRGGPTQGCVALPKAGSDTGSQEFPLRLIKHELRAVTQCREGVAGKIGIRVPRTGDHLGQNRLRRGVLFGCWRDVRLLALVSPVGEKE